MKGFQLRYVALVAGSLLVMLMIAAALITDSAARFFVVGLVYVFVVTIAAVFLSHRAVGPTRRIEEELREIVENKNGSHQLKIREGDDFEGLVHAINKLLEKTGRK